jgi:predicted ArsR family transcriptional regulator
METKLDFNQESFADLPLYRSRTAYRIVQFIASNPQSTVEEIAKGVGLSNSAVRYGLLDLLAFNVIHALSTLDQPGPRGRGRPAYRYVLKKALLISSPPRRFWQLSDIMISTLLDRLGVEGTERIFQHMGRRSANETTDHWRKDHRLPLSLQTFRRLLSQQLNQIGYNADLKIEGRKMVIVTRNCLFGEVSRKYEGLVCNFHLAYYPTLLSTTCGKSVQNVSRTSCMARGDDKCRTVLTLA